MKDSEISMALRPFSHGLSMRIQENCCVRQAEVAKHHGEISICTSKGKTGEYDQRKDHEGFSLCGPSLVGFRWKF